MIVRGATASDQDALVRLINRAFLVERFFIDGDRIDRAEVERLLAKGSFLVADADGDLRACVYVEPRGARAYIGLLSVDPDHQRQGLGELMMSRAEQHSRLHGADVVDIRVVNLRAELPPFYKRLGYEEVGAAPFESSAAPAQPCHFLLMAKRL
jgi:GNAT superfamily N-acetyltransferase